MLSLRKCNRLWTHELLNYDQRPGGAATIVYIPSHRECRYAVAIESIAFLHKLKHRQRPVLVDTLLSARVRAVFAHCVKVAHVHLNLISSYLRHEYRQIRHAQFLREKSWNFVRWFFVCLITCSDYYFVGILTPE